MVDGLAAHVADGEGLGALCTRTVAAQECHIALVLKADATQVSVLHLL